VHVDAIPPPGPAVGPVGAVAASPAERQAASAPPALPPPNEAPPVTGGRGESTPSGVPLPAQRGALLPHEPPMLSREQMVALILAAVPGT
jgi:hypothetical protein